VVTGGAVIPADIHIQGESITAVEAPDPAASDVIDAGGALIFPGLVDTHVHLNEPGRADWEGFETGTRAAAAGGVTTLIEMPLNSIPATTTVAAYQEKIRAAEGKLSVDTGFWGGVVPGNVNDLEPLWNAGVFGFKCFLCDSGVTEFEHVSQPQAREAVQVLSALHAPLLVHAELPARLRMPAGGSPGDWLASRPPFAEWEAIAMMIKLARENHARMHIVHLSASGSLPLIEQAKEERVQITVETCPHYLAFASDTIRNGATEFKCAPPLRGADNRGRLRDALQDGRIDMVVSDHSPSPPEMKTGDFRTAWGGIASLELGLPVIMGLFDAPGETARWMSDAPARLAGLKHKGRIEPGFDADLVIFDDRETWSCDPRQLRQRHKYTPYAGFPMRGRVKTTYLRGRKIYDDGDFPMPPAGRILTR
jgi:allantoinase